MRGQPDRPASIGAERRGNEARRDRRGRTRRRTARNAFRVPRVAGGSQIGVVSGRAISELRHVQRADAKRSGGGEPRQYGCGRRRDPPLAQLRAAFRHLAFDVIHVLVGERHAIQRAFRVAAGKRAVRFLGSSESFVLLDAHECVDDGLPAPDPLEHPSRQLAGGECAAAQRACDLGKR